MVKSGVFLLFFLLFLTACREEEVMVFKSKGKELVMTGFLLDDHTAASVNLTWASFNQLPDNSVSNAKVFLTNEDGKTVMMEYDGFDAYVAPLDSMAIEPGKSYRVEASAENKTITASCTLPFQFDAEVQAIWDTVRISPELLRWRIWLKWIDQPGQTNYYRIGGSLVGEAFMPDGSTTTVFSSFSQPDGKYLYEENDLKNGYFDGYLELNLEYARFIPAMLQFEVRNIDRPYFRFHQDLQNFGNGGDIFPEPYKVFSNISNGFGVFCGSTRIYQNTIMF